MAKQSKFDVEAEAERIAFEIGATLGLVQGDLNVIIAAASEVNHGDLTEHELWQIVNYIETI